MHVHILIRNPPPPPSLAQNPVDSEAVEVLLSDADDGGGDPVECLCDQDCLNGSVENCYDGVGGEVGFTVHLRTARLLLDHYMIVQV